MPSSRRSSVSTTATLRSRPPALWRTMNTSKSTEACTGTSYVFAEPLLSAPKRERSYSVEELDCKEQLDEGFESAAAREERREPAPAAPPADEPVPPPPTAAPSLTISVTEAVPVIAVSPSPSPSPITPSPFPAPPPMRAEIPQTAEPRKPSWFASLSRTKGCAAQLHRRAVTTSAAAVAAASASTASLVEPPPTPTVTVTMTPTPEPARPATSDSTPPESTPTPVQSDPTPISIPAASLPLPDSRPPTPLPSPARSVPKRSWFSSRTSSPAPAPAPSPSPAHPTPQRTPSLDEVVPPLAQLVFPASPSAGGGAIGGVGPGQGIVVSPSTALGGVGGARPRLSSLNPSNSRFSLSMPLLGRAVAVGGEGMEDRNGNGSVDEGFGPPLEEDQTPRAHRSASCIPWWDDVVISSLSFSSTSTTQHAEYPLPLAQNSKSNDPKTQPGGTGRVAEVFFIMGRLSPPLLSVSFNGGPHLSRLSPSFDRVSLFSRFSFLNSFLWWRFRFWSDRVGVGVGCGQWGWNGTQAALGHDVVGAVPQFLIAWITSPPRFLVSVSVLEGFGGPKAFVYQAFRFLGLATYIQHSARLSSSSTTTTANTTTALTPTSTAPTTSTSTTTLSAPAPAAPPPPTDSTTLSAPAPPPPLPEIIIASSDPADSAAPAIEASSSWWSYVGWSGSSASTGSVDADGSKEKGKEKEKEKEEGGAAKDTAEVKGTEIETETETKVKVNEEVETDPNPAAVTVVEPTPEPEAQNVNMNAGVMATTTTTTLTTASLTTTGGGAETEGDTAAAAATASGSAWYSPWAWYPSTSTSALDSTTTPAPAPTTSASASPPSAEPPAAVEPTPEPTPPPPAEPEPEPEPESTPAPEPEPKPEPAVNPVEATLSTNRSGWASFFSSRALLVKRIPDVERDKDGMEVMDIPDDEGGSVEVVGEGEKVEQRGKDKVEVGKDKADVKKEQKGKEEVKPKEEPGKGKAERGRPIAIPAKNSTQDKTAASTSRASSLTPSTSLKAKAPPLIIADSIKFSVPTKPPSPTPSTKSVASTKSTAAPIPSSSAASSSTAATTKPGTKKASGSGSRAHTPTPRAPNLVLPTWDDTFHALPRSRAPPSHDPNPNSHNAGEGSGGALSKTMRFVSGVLFSGDGADSDPEKRAREREREREREEKERERRFGAFSAALPRAWDVMRHPDPPAPPPASAQQSRWGKGKGKERARETGAGLGLGHGEKAQMEDVLRGCRRVLVIGIHGWFPGAVMRSVIGEPTGTSSKFVSMMVQALEEFQEAHGVTFDKITKVPLEGEGTIEGRVARLSANLKSNQEWMDDLHAADAILVATHSQGSIVSTHLLDRLIQDGHIRTARSSGTSTPAAPTMVNTVRGAAERVLSTVEALPLPVSVPHLELTGQVHRKPQRYFESAAARELFEFQNTESEVSKNYVKALRSIVGHGTKMVYVASLNDQVVPIYSGLFTAASHPLILRALYIDGDAYHSSDFLSNLLVLLLRILNSGISDSGLTVHLSEATAGSLNGVGHSTAYEEISTYALAVKYLFLTNDGLEDHRSDLVLEPFNAAMEQNDYEIPWSLRDVIADERVTHFFSQEISGLRDAFRDWHPKTTILRDLKRKLQPIQRLPSTFHSLSSSKL
ncbi:hypothetical protein DXG01_004133 [Tephrocybe rancida]|nr:hypothetical protein DXG01_004133 [Tephrocybe rancida]